jgi:transcription initiation factor IIE alpha subunit
MLISVKCETCKRKHHDHYACSECGMQISSVEKPPSKWKFCPGCGAAFRNKDTSARTDELREALRGYALEHESNIGGRCTCRHCQLARAVLK